MVSDSNQKPYAFCREVTSHSFGRPTTINTGLFGRHERVDCCEASLSLSLMRVHLKMVQV